MKKTSSRRFAKLLGLLLAAALLVSALPLAAQAAMPSDGLTGGYFVTGTPPFAYFITGQGSSQNTVKLYQNGTMQSYEDYVGTYTIPEKVFSQEDMRYYTVTELSGARGTVPGALEGVPLSGVTLPGTVTIIGNRAFANCRSLSEVVFPTSVVDLANDAFSGVSLRKLTLDVTSPAGLANDRTYQPEGSALPVNLPERITDLTVRADLAIIGQADIPGNTTLAGGQIMVQSGADLILDGPLSGVGTVDVADGSSLTLNASAEAFTGSLRLSGASSALTNNSSAPVTVLDASGKSVAVQPGDTRTGGQVDTAPTTAPIPVTHRPRITTNYGGVVNVEDEGKTVVIIAYRGYHVKEVSINGLFMGDITRYEFETASTKNIVTVTFEEGGNEEGPSAPSIDPVFRFTDVSPFASYADAIRFLVNDGIFQGVSKDRFAPDNVVTRGMLASLLRRMEVYGRRFQLDVDKDELEYPSDVNTSAWYANDVAWAVQNGLMTVEHGKFRPTEPVTRQELSLALYRFTKARGYGTVMDARHMYIYLDTRTLPATSRRALGWMGSRGYLPVRDHLLYPKASVTRGEIAETLASYIQSF